MSLKGDRRQNIRTQTIFGTQMYIGGSASMCRISPSKGALAQEPSKFSELSKYAWLCITIYTQIRVKKFGVVEDVVCPL